jgi:hypothetical protein
MAGSPTIPSAASCGRASPRSRKLLIYRNPGPARAPADRQPALRTSAKAPGCAGTGEDCHSPSGRAPLYRLLTIFRQYRSVGTPSDIRSKAHPPPAATHGRGFSCLKARPTCRPAARFVRGGRARRWRSDEWRRRLWVSRRGRKGSTVASGSAHGGVHEVSSAIVRSIRSAGSFGRAWRRPDPARAEFSNRTAGTAAAAAAASNDSRHLQHHLRFGGDELPEYVCGPLSQHAGQPAVQSDLHHATARLQAAVLGGPGASCFLSECPDAQPARHRNGSLARDVSPVAERRRRRQILDMPG